MMHFGERSSHSFRTGTQVRQPEIRDAAERRQSPRYEVGLAIRFRILQASTASEWRAGTVHDLSSTGVSFQCRHALPVNTRIEMVIDWPSTHGTIHPISLRASGDVVRGRDRRVAVQMTSCRMGTEKATSPVVNAASSSGT
jgi:PilZ domain-containing protein